MTTKDQKPGEEKTVFMKCRNPNKRCDSIEAIEVKYAQGTRLYRCVKCKHHASVSVGGKMDIRSA